MLEGQFVFSQLMDFLPRREFSACVAKYRGDRRSRGFSCRDQFLCMGFAQLTYRESLRDVETCLRALGPKLYHVGFRGKVSRSTLADANAAHDWRIYAEFAQVLIRRARKLYRLVTRSGGRLRVADAASAYLPLPNGDESAAFNDAKFLLRPRDQDLQR